MKDCKPLFKLGKSGQIQTWRVQQDGGRYRFVHGVMNGAMVTSEWTTCKPKNVGKANETSAEEQAWAEIQSRYKKQVEQGGYVDELKYVGRHTYFVPMLAKTWRREPSVQTKWWKDGGLWSQPKLDGARMVLTASGAWSRKGKPIPTAGHIQEALGSIFDTWPDLVLDGELYNHELKDDFPRLMSIIRKVNVTAAEIYEATRTLQFHVFDCAGSHGHLPFNERFEFVREVLQPHLVVGDPVRLVETVKVTGFDHIDQVYESLLLRGYEGQIIRSCPAGSSYDVGPNRSRHLLKRKEFLDKEFRIEEVLEGEGNKSGMAGAIRYRMSKVSKLKKWETFKSGLRGDRAFLKDLWKRREEFIGGLGTVRFQGYSPKGIPRFPVTVAVWEKDRTY